MREEKPARRSHVYLWRMCGACRVGVLSRETRQSGTSAVKGVQQAEVWDFVNEIVTMWGLRKTFD